VQLLEREVRRESVASPCGPWRVTTSFRPCAAASRASGQSTSAQAPARFTIGRVEALVAVEALVREAVAVREPEFVDVSLRSGSTRITRSFLVCTTRFEP
jgi:hypothetical protein